MGENAGAVDMVAVSTLTVGGGFSGEGTLNATGTLTAEATVTRPSKLQLAAPGLDVSHGVVVLLADLTDEPDAACVIEVQDLDGELLVSGVGKTPADAVSLVFEHMLPPTSSEYLPPDEGMPDHDS